MACRCTWTSSLGTDINTDQILAQMRTGQANSQLPSEVTQQGVIVQPGTTAPFMLLDLYSPTGAYDNIFLANYATINLQYALTRISGRRTSADIRRRPLCHAHLGES